MYMRRIYINGVVRTVKRYHSLSRVPLPQSVLFRERTSAANPRHLDVV